ncbi:MAG: baseplate J/gp47 family protein [Lachnospiraceae bacterium]|nr:baseplate J/gp47 family protein [Lachnospiraceae bacterium]
MLRIEEARPKTYEEIIADALTEIPLFSDEWSNFNPSDPGITVLENLSVFSALQASNIPNVTYEARRRLFALAGFKPAKGKCARVLLKAEGVRENTLLPAGSRFSLGGLIFETNRPAAIGGKILGIYAQEDGSDEFTDMSSLAERDVPVGLPVFGEKAVPGNALYLVSDSLPEAEKELILYLTLLEAAGRNPVDDRQDNVFAAIRWECYTDKGFSEIKVRDFTGCFLSSGEIRLRIPDGACVCRETPREGYCIRAVLERADYDVAPRVQQIEPFLFELWQRDSRAAALIYHRSERITVRHPLASEEHILVFGKEEKGSSYRRYQLSYSGDEPGRFCRYTPGEYGPDGRQSFFTIEFLGEEHQPDTRLKDPIRIVLYSEEVMRQYEIGRVLGYDDQELNLPLRHLVQDSFCLIARRTDENGEYLYDFVRPEKSGEGALYYHLLENDGRIIIEEAGDYIGADLFVAAAAVTEGEKGNVRAHSRFRALSELPVERWFNPGAGTGGAHRETIAEMGMRFRRDIDTPFTAVTAKDYEKIALETPALCLRKAHAVIDEAENLVQIAVLPGVGGERPELSGIYKKEIAARLEERRLLTTRVLVLSPRYMEVHIRGTVYVKRHFENPRKDILETIRNLVDDVHSERGFGEPLLFKQIFAAIEALECVSFVYELSVMPDDRGQASVIDSDIYPEPDVLCVAGEIAIETVRGE